MRVTFTDDVGVLGLAVGRVLEARTQCSDKARKLAKLRGTFVLLAGNQSVTLDFDPSGVIIGSGPYEGRAKATMQAPSSEWLTMLRSGGSKATALIAVLEGRMSIRGNPLAALRLFSVLGACKQHRKTIELTRYQESS